MSSIAHRAALRFLPALFLAMIIGLLAACGGGGSSAPAPAAVPVSITSQPSSASVLAGASATFTVAATGDGLAYQWQLSTDGGATWANVAGATTASYATPAVDVSFSGQQYRVVVSGTANSVTSSAVTLTVPAAQVPPVVTVQPASQAAVAGADASFSVTASGTSLTYQWQSGPDGSTWANVSGATAATLVLNAVAASDNGKRLRVLVVNAAGSTASDGIATLTVTAAPVAPQITTQPQSASVVVPQTAMFTVVATGTPAPSYQWQTSADGAAYTDIDGANSASYTTPAAASSDPIKFYRVRVSNSAATLFSNAATLTVMPAPVAPTISVQPVTVTVSVPATANFFVVANGTPTPTYQWQLSLDNGASFANINGAVSANYSTPATVDSDTGKQFRVVVSNSAGNVTSTPASLTIFVGATSLAGDPVAISIDPSGNLYVSVAVLDFNLPALSLYGIQKVSPGGAVSTVAGGPTAPLLDGVGSTARFHVNGAIAVDASGTVYAADSDGVSLISPMARVIRRVASDGTVTTIAGGPAAYADGTGFSAHFANLSGMVTDSHGNLFIADPSLNIIRKMTPAAVVTTVAGNYLVSGFADGTGTGARFNAPRDVAIDANDNLYVVDSNNYAIRKVSPLGVVSTIVHGSFGFADGTGSAVKFGGNASGIAVDSAGNVFVADTGNNRIRKVTPAGDVTTLAGNATAGSINGTGAGAFFDSPMRLAVDGSGNVYVTELLKRGIRKITPAGVVTTFAP